MTELFGRAYRLTVGTTLIEGGAPRGGARFGFDCKFTVKRSLKPEPNTLEIDVYNLGLDTIAALSVPKQAIQLDAGYTGGMCTLFIGYARSVATVRSGADSETKVTGGDGEQALRKARVNVSMPATPTAPKDIAEAITKTMSSVTAGIGKGNADRVVEKLGAGLNAGLAKLGKVGVTLVGSAPRQMTALAKSTGLEWSVQADKLQVLERGKALADQAIVLNPSTGLIGIPTVETKGNTAGRVKARALMVPDLFPGRVVVIQSEAVTGQFRVEATTHSGQFSAGGQDWYVDLEGRPY